MSDGPNARIDNPESLCETIDGIISNLEDSEIIDHERASELRSSLYRSIDIPDRKAEPTDQDLENGG